MKQIVVLALCVAVALGVRRKGNDAYLDSDELFHLDWTFTDKEITFTVTANTTGWIGLGFSPNGGMEGADIITAWVKDGKAYLQDRYATGKRLPTVDDEQNVKLIEGKEQNGQTIIKFSRDLVTCDKQQKDRPIMEDTMRIIWAMSADGSDPTGNNPSYHSTNRGTRSLYLLVEAPTAQSIPADAITYDFTNENVLIPTRDTMYWCEIRKAPTLNKKHHMIKMEPIIQKENLGLVHHIIVYACFDNVDREHYFGQNGATGYNCYDQRMPTDIQSCKATIIVWAIGGEEVYFPEEAGYPFGDATSPTYFLIETHYDNPQLVHGRRDSSGIRITLTPTLRQYDAGVLEAGAVNGLNIPPKQKDFIANVFCSSNCTKAALKQDINVFGVFLHSHLAGRKVITRQFRNGKDIGIFAADHHYDFNYQQGRILTQPKVIKPGDDIMVSCHYNTQDRTGPTVGGLSSREEMCLAFLTYYPKQDISNCWTVPVWQYIAEQYLNTTFGVTKTPGSSETVIDLIMKVNWTNPANVKKHQDNYNVWPQVEQCQGLDMQSKLPQEAVMHAPNGAEIESIAEDLNAQCAVPTVATTDKAVNSAVKTAAGLTFIVFLAVLI